jgi:hypothetical protein
MYPSTSDQYDLSSHVATRLVPWVTLLFACSCRQTIDEWSLLLSALLLYANRHV